jgi:hypothetical protein
LPASESLVAFTITITRIFVSCVSGRFPPPGPALIASL